MSQTNKYLSIFSKFNLICFGIFTTLVFILSTKFFMINYLMQNSAKGIFTLIIMLIVVSVYIYFSLLIPTDNSKLNLYTLAILILFFIGVSLIWLQLVPEKQISDFGHFWRQAPSALNGKPLFTNPNQYFAKYAYQSGFMIYVMALEKIFGQNILIMQLCNIVTQALILVVSYFTSLKVFNNVKAARVTVILLSISLDWFALNSQADNQYLGSLFFLVAIYLLLVNRFWSIGLSGLMLAIGWIIRPIGPVIFIAAVLYLLLFINDKKKFDKIVKVLILTLICFTTIFGASFLIKSSGLNPYGLKNTDTEWKFIAGLNAETNGTYSVKLDKYLNRSASRATNKATEKRVLKQEIKQLNANKGWLTLFVAKLATLWAKGTETIAFSQFNKIHSFAATHLMTSLGFLSSYLLILFSWIGSMSLFKSRDNFEMQMLILPILGFTAVELIIEVQGRYRIELLPIIAIVSGIGTIVLIEQLQKNRYLVSFKNKIFETASNTIKSLSDPFS